MKITHYITIYFCQVGYLRLLLQSKTVCFWKFYCIKLLAQAFKKVIYG